MEKATLKKDKKPGQIKLTGTQSLPALEDLPVNFNIPTHHADMVNIMISTDGFALIRFFSRVPGLNVEECRVSISHVLAKKLVDLLINSLNQFPQNSKSKKKDNKAVSKSAAE